MGREGPKVYGSLTFLSVGQILKLNLQMQGHYLTLVHHHETLLSQGLQEFLMLVLKVYILNDSC